MKFSNGWTDEELLMLEAALERNYACYSRITNVYAELLLELKRRKQLTIHRAGGGTTEPWSSDHVAFSAVPYIAPKQG